MTQAQMKKCLLIVKSRLEAVMAAEGCYFDKISVYYQIKIFD